MNNSELFNRLTADSSLDNSTSVSNQNSNPEPFVVNEVLSNDPLTILCSRAKTHGFKIHDVPGDGNCLFSSLTYHSSLLGLQNIENKELRTMVADYLEENLIVDGSHYSHFLP